MNPSSHNLLLHRTFQYIGIILVLAALGGGYWYWKNARAAQTVTDNRPSFEAPLTTSLDLAAGVGGPTFSRADGADRRATVTDFEGRIIPVKQNEARFEGARRVENLASSSENFGTWIGSGGATVTTNTTTAPDGNLSADAINSTGINSRVYFIKSENAGYFANRSFRHTVWVKSLTGGDTPAALYLRNQVESVFTGQSGGLTTFTATTTWQRVTTLTSIGNDTASTGMSVWIRAGDNISAYGNIAVWGAQLEDVTGQTNQNPSEYVSCGVKPSAPYHGANVDCVKYFDTQNGNTVASNIVTETTGAKIPSSTLKGYLAEGSRINLLARSEEVDNGIWTGSNVTISANAVSAPSGQMNADTMTETTAASTQFQRANSVTISSGSTYTISAFVKRGSGTTRHMRLELSGSTHGFRANFNTDTGAVASTAVIGSGTVATAGSVAYPNGWYRFYVTGTASTETSVTFFYRMTASLDGSITYTGDGSSSFYVWGAQLEQASFASSYIPTTTASVTRALDSLSYPETGNMNDTIGSAYVEATPYWTGGYGWDAPWLQDSISSQNFRIWHWGGGANHVGTDRGSGVTRNQTDTTLTLTSGVPIRLGFSYNNTATREYNNGSLAGSDTTLTLPYDTLNNQLYIGRGFSIGAFSAIKNVRIWKKALSDTELTNMTSATDAIANSATRETTVKAPDNTGLVGYWSFEDGSGTKAEDFSPSGANTGTLKYMESTDWSDGKIGKSLVFDGVDEFVTMGDVLNMGTGNFSVSAWVKSTSTAVGSNNGIVYKRGTGQYYSPGYRLNMPNGIFNFHIADGTNYVSLNSTATGKNDGKWHHVVGVAERGTSLRLYVDGIFDAAAAETTVGNINSPAVNFSIGALSTDGSNYYHPFDGSIDEVRIYNRALSATEIAGLYNQSAASHTTVNVNQNDKITSGLVGFWSFNGKDISGTTAYDRSGNSNDGTLTNGPTVYPGKVGQALSFDGGDDYVNAGTSSSLSFGNSNPFSLSVWINPSAYHTVGYYNLKNGFIGRGPASTFNYALQASDATTISFIKRKSSEGLQFYNFTGIPDLTNKWTLISVTVSSNTASLYVNGSYFGAQPIGTIESVTGDVLNIGTVLPTSAESSFIGVLDEVRIYNRALSATEIASLYSMGR